MVYKTLESESNNISRDRGQCYLPRTMPVCMVATVTRNGGVVALLVEPHLKHNG